MKTPLLQAFYLFSLLFLLPINSYSQWKSLPIRSLEEFNLGAVGGEGEQYLHGFSRCLTQPNYVYAAQDVCGSWRSTDGGTTWNKGMDKGLYLSYSQSIEVDPIDPNKVLIVVDQSSAWAGSVLNYEGIYKSIDGGTSWKQVLNTTETSVRRMRHLIAYSLPSKPSANTSPTRWFSADNQSLWRSDAAGDSASWIKMASIPVNSVVIDVVTHPTSIDTVYLATTAGLFRTTNGGANLAEVPFFTGKNVTSVLMNAALPNKIYVTVYADGVYYSADNGATFTKKTITVNGTNIGTKICRAVMNPGFSTQIYLIGATSSSSAWVTQDGMLTWKLLPSSTTFPGLGRETGWRRYLDDIYCAICPNPLDKTNAIATSRSTFHKIKVTPTTVTVTESATGFTGNASMQTDRSIAFHPYDSNVFGIFCFDIAARITSTNGSWFYKSDPIISSWKGTKTIKWTGSYSAAFQPVFGSKIVLASIGHYLAGGQSQIMRSTDNGQTWGTMPVTVVNGDVTTFMQAYHYIGFDPQTPSIAYAGSLISKNAGQTFSQITFPADYLTPAVTYAPTPSICGVSIDPITKISSVFAVDGNRRYILRSDDQGSTWFLFSDLSLLGGAAKFHDSSPTFAAHPNNPNVIYALDAKRDLMEVTYNPTTAKATAKSLNVFGALPSWVPTGVKSYNQIRRIGIDPIDNNVMYVSMLASGIPSIFRTLDAGKTWASISNDLNYQGGCVVVNPHTRELYKGSMSGTSIYPAPPATGITEMEELSSLSIFVELDQMQLKVFGAKASDQFTIYNITGRAVMHFNGTATPISGLSSGIYILRCNNYKPVKFIK